MNYRKINLPKQNWDDDSDETENVKIAKEIYDQLYEAIDEFTVNKIVETKKLKEGLKLIGYHKEEPELYKIIEDICLDCELNEKSLTTDEFVDCINERLGDCTTRKGINRIFDSICNKKINEITPKDLKNIYGDDLSEKDIEYMMKVIAEPSNKINIDSDEFFYIMTKRPEDVVKITNITKNI